MPHPWLTQIILLIHILKDRGFTKFDYDEKTIDLIKQELNSLAKKGYIEFEIKEINFSDQTDRLPLEKLYLEITKCKNPYHNVPNGLHKTPKKKKSTPAKQATGPISVSKGQDRIRDLLYFNNIPFKQEHTEVINGRVHRFDFLVYKDNGVIYFIEYDGEQHFKPVKQWGGEAGFKERQARDEEKNGYELIRIPYTVQNEITIKDLRPETSPFVLWQFNHFFLTSFHFFWRSEENWEKLFRNGSYLGLRVVVQLIRSGYHNFSNQIN